MVFQRNRLLPAAAALVLACGCEVRAPVRQSVSRSRAQSYERWQDTREGKDPGAIVRGKLSLADAVKVALTHSKSVLAALKERDIAEGRRLEAYSFVYPKVDMSAGYTRMGELPGFEVGGQTVTLGEEDNYSVGLSVSQPLYGGGATPAGIRMAAVYALLSDETVRESTQKAVYDTAQAYFDTVLARHLLAAEQAAFTSAKKHLDDVAAKETQGVASKFDVLRTRVELSNIRAEMIRKKNALDLALVSLLKAMGVSQESKVELSDDLTYEALKPSLANAVKTAYRSRPDLQKAELGVLLQEQMIRYEKSGYKPSVDLFFNQDWTRPDSTGEDEWGDSWTAGITVRWSVFDGMARKGRVTRETAVLEQRKIQVAQAEERVLLEIRAAVLNLKHAEELVESQKEGLTLAKEVLDVADVAYREGTASRLEVSDARTAFVKATGLYYRAIHSHAMARLSYQKVVGTLGPPVHEGER
jgi:outer membrane protein